MVPSDAVDQVWHLHLLDTRAYWEYLCSDLIGRPIYHTPSRGGETERRRYRERYVATLERYRTVFGDEPPRDIWPNAGERFAGRFRRVDLNDVWVVRKAWPLAAGVSGLVVVILSGCADLGLPPKSLQAWTLLVALLAFVGWQWKRERDSKRDRGGGAGGGSGGIGTSRVATSTVDAVVSEPASEILPQCSGSVSSPLGLELAEHPLARTPRLWCSRTIWTIVVAACSTISRRWCVPPRLGAYLGAY